MIFNISENNISNSVVLHKGKILRWYEKNNKDIILMKDLKPKKYTKIASGQYVRSDKYNMKSDIEQLGDLDTYLGTDAISGIGFEYNDKLIFMLEIYVDGIRKIGPVPAPKFTYKFIPISSIAKKHEGYYINKVRYNLDLSSNQKAAKFLKDQYLIMSKEKSL